VPKLFEEISKHTNVFLALLTGNFEDGARIKLEPFLLNSLFPVGAFGDDGFLRTDLSQIAVRRAENYYETTFESNNIVVIGDTAADVECAKALHARSIGISRIPAIEQQLKESGPDHIFHGTEDISKIVKAILG